MTGSPRVHLVVRPIHTVYLPRAGWVFPTCFRRALTDQPLIDGVRHDIAAAGTGYANYITTQVGNSDIVIVAVGQDRFARVDGLAHQAGIVDMAEAAEIVELFKRTDAQAKLVARLNQQLQGRLLVLESGDRLSDLPAMVIEALKNKVTAKTTILKVIGEATDECIVVGRAIAERKVFEQVVLNREFCIDECLVGGETYATGSA